ncbi:hypothetical protein EGH24_03405 [Halonotius terrestris]|uniref:Uncharacterized protein n=1 Tax=Halonotius terrestris TaxID=2487750 RepID=A0A8J8PEV4_9EURY|nr:hypothetical protein [Halonotius terrestris]TQQ83836.1 hypothetical protein EGH24_03405 [Halonotius terrestris]
MIDETDTTVEQLSARERRRLFRTLRTGECGLAELRQTTGVAAKTLAATLDDLRERGLLEERTTERETLETEYRCSQELTGAEPAPITRSYVLTATGESVCATLNTTVCAAV